VTFWGNARHIDWSLTVGRRRTHHTVEIAPPQTGAAFPAKAMADAVAPEAIADVIAFLVSDAAVQFAGRSCQLTALREPTWRVNHCDLVRTSHLAGGDPGSVAKPRTAAGARAPRLQGDTVTSPASSAGSAADLPDCKPTPPVRARPRPQ
jgi:hypothetical protein